MVLCLLAFSFTASAHGSDTLRIGDPAPRIAGKWIKGIPVNDYDKNKLYVVEFWATWCGPCRRAMPHLSKLAAAYAGKAVFVGVDVLEKTGDQPYESAMPAVEKFVKNMGDDMAYNVSADDNSQYMANRWIKAAGITGIPATFLIKEGRLIWIGDPFKLEDILTEVIGGRFDETKFAAEYNKKAMSNAARTAELMAILQPVTDALAAKEYQKAIQEIDKAMVKKSPLSLKLANMKFTTLLEHVSEQQALDYAREWKKTEPASRGLIVEVIASKTGLSKEAYELALDYGKEALNAPGSIIPQIYGLLAKCYAKAGDIASAVSNQETALDTAKKALATNKYPGYVTPDTIKSFEDSLASYKAALR